MSDLQITRLNPWKNQPLGDIHPGEAIYVGRYDLNMEMVFTYTEALFLSGGPEWHLWAVQREDGSIIDQIVDQVATWGPGCLAEHSGAGLAVSCILQSDPRTAARAMYKVLMRARFHHTMPCAPFSSGLLSAEELGREVDEFREELERNSQAAEADRSRRLPLWAAPLVVGGRGFRGSTAQSGPSPRTGSTETRLIQPGLGVGMAPIDALVDEFKRCAHTRSDWMNFRSHREHQDPVTVAAMSPKHLASRSGQALSLGMGALWKSLVVRRRSQAQEFDADEWKIAERETFPFLSG